MARTVDPARHRAVRERIQHAAAALFASQGFDGTSTAEISQAAGMSTGNLFHYFPSKRDIFVAVLTEGEGEKGARLAAARDREDAWQALLEVVDIMVEPATHPLGPPLVLEAMLQAQRDPELAAWLQQDETEEQEVLASVVARAIADGSIDPGLDAAETAAWIGVLVAAVYQRAMGEDGSEPALRVSTLRLLLGRFLRASA